MNITLRGTLLPILLALVATFAFTTTGCVGEPDDLEDDAEGISEIDQELASADNDGTPLDTEEEPDDAGPKGSTLQGSDAEAGEDKEDPPPLPWHLVFTAASNPAPTPEPGTISNNGGAPSGGHNNN